MFQLRRDQGHAIQVLVEKTAMSYALGLVSRENSRKIRRIRGWNSNGLIQPHSQMSQ